MKTLKAGLLYFTVVFAAGFVLGTIRTLWVASRTAELVEAPIMLALSIVAARCIVRRCMPLQPAARLGMG